MKSLIDPLLAPADHHRGGHAACRLHRHPRHHPRPGADDPGGLLGRHRRHHQLGERLGPRRSSPTSSRNRKRCSARSPACKSMISTSAAGQGTIRLEFETGTDIAEAEDEVLQKLDEVPGYPDGVLQPVVEDYRPRVGRLHRVDRALLDRPGLRSRPALRLHGPQHQAALRAHPGHQRGRGARRDGLRAADRGRSRTPSPSAASPSPSCATASPPPTPTSPAARSSRASATSGSAPPAASTPPRPPAT